MVIPQHDLVSSDASQTLATPAVGSSASDLIAPCGRPGPRPPDPVPVEEPTIAVALSGGGFRATLAGLGVLKLLADCGLLGRVRYSSSVSGGSVANGLFASHYDEVAEQNFTGEAFDQIVVRPFIDRISSASFIWKLVSGFPEIIGRKTRTNLLADSFSDWFFGNDKLADTPTACRFIFNSANLTTGVRFTFEREVVGDYVSGYARTAPTNLRLADAVAASAAFPIAFTPLHLDLDLPCGKDRPPALLDGGVYDNMGLEAIDGLRHGEIIIALNAGGLFYVHARYGRLPIIRDFLRLNSILYRQSTGLRRREMVERFQAWEQTKPGHHPDWARRGVLFGLTTTFDKDPVAPEWTDSRPERADLIQELARAKTTFARFKRATCDQLVYRGWWLTGATLATYHREVLPASLPPVRNDAR